MSDRMKRTDAWRPRPVPASGGLLLVLALAGCGGGGGGDGGGGGPATNSAAPAVVSTALAATTPPAGLKQIGAFAPPMRLRASQLLSDPGRFKHPQLSYVAVWYEDTSGNRQQLLFMRLAALQALEGSGGVTLMLPAHVTRLFFEIYDSGGAATALGGEVKP